MIEIQELCKYYGQSRAVGPLSTSIEKGEVVGLLGLNGAGKTTTQRILACDLLPSSGTVKVAGIDVVEHPEEVRRRIGYLPDVPPLYDEMRVGEYLQFALELRGKPASEGRQRVPAVAERLGLSQVLREPLFSLSHGFRQRVGIAQAVVHDPELVVLDEPISGLDPVQIVEMRNLIHDLKQNHTVLISSHILTEISQTCDRLLVLGEGELKGAGTEAELSSQFGEIQQISVTVRGGEREAIAKLLAGIEGVQSVTDPFEQGGGITFTLATKKDCRADVSRAVVNAQLDLLKLDHSRSELESTFIRLVGGTDASN